MKTFMTSVLLNTSVSCNITSYSCGVMYNVFLLRVEGQRITYLMVKII